MVIGLVQSDLDSANQIRNILEEVGYEVHVFSRGSVFLQAIEDLKPDLFVVDKQVADMSGVEIVKKIYSFQLSRAPSLLLMSRLEEVDASFFLGAEVNDYCIKPVRPKEFLARVSALLRGRSKPIVIRTDLSFLGYSFVAQENSVTFGGRTVSLSEQEFHLAIFLFSNFERTVSRQRVIDEVLSKQIDAHTTSSSVDILVSSLRKKLNLSVTSPTLRIKTVYGFGYRLIAVA